MTTGKDNNMQDEAKVSEAEDNKQDTTTVDPDSE